jgi:ABC-type amino acid transport substrate-binding protein
MRKKIMIILAAAVFLAVATVPLSAQQVLMNSAETINKGNLKLAIFPTLLFAKGGNDSLWGVAGRFGYGLTSNIDIEAKAAFFKGLKYYGADIEYWFLKGEKFNVSAAVGAHMTDYKGGGDSKGIDVALLASHRPVKNLEIYGGLMSSFDSIKNGDNYTLLHLVPGIEYRLSDDLDFLAEVGIALNDNSRSYGSVGLAYYFLR